MHFFSDQNAFYEHYQQPQPNFPSCISNYHETVQYESQIQKNEKTVKIDGTTNSLSSNKEIFDRDFERLFQKIRFYEGKLNNFYPQNLEGHFKFIISNQSNLQKSHFLYLVQNCSLIDEKQKNQFLIDMSYEEILIKFIEQVASNVQEYLRNQVVLISHLIWKEYMLLGRLASLIDISLPSILSSELFERIQVFFDKKQNQEFFRGFIPRTKGMKRKEVVAQFLKIVEAMCVAFSTVLTFFEQESDQQLAEDSKNINNSGVSVNYLSRTKKEIIQN